MNKKAADFSEGNFNQMKTIEADLVRELQQVVKNPSKKAELSDAIFKNHQNWLKIIIPNYSSKIHLGIIDGYENDKRYQSYYDDKAGKGASKILISVVKEHLVK